ncbi:ribosomal protein L24e family protein [Striga asiatica]|uniref:Ribosomal protein L24e family protein n=1 Tax=Striga asiatica TaxID=4170 RepID=A0A5A7QN76_STRAF|nr:ribosomal protein L24e family protein [Striga asiatica]
MKNLWKKANNPRKTCDSVNFMSGHDKSPASDNAFEFDDVRVVEPAEDRNLPGHECDAVRIRPQWDPPVDGFSGHRRQPGRPFCRRQLDLWQPPEYNLRRRQLIIPFHDGLQIIRNIVKIVTFFRIPRFPVVCHVTSPLQHRLLLGLHIYFFKLPDMNWAGLGSRARLAGHHIYFFKRPDMNWAGLGSRARLGALAVALQTGPRLLGADAAHGRLEPINSFRKRHEYDELIGISGPSPKMGRPTRKDIGGG